MFFLPVTLGCNKFGKKSAYIMSSLTILHHAVETDYSYSFLVFLNALSSALEFNYLEAKAEVC